MDSQRPDQPGDRLVDLELQHVYKSFDDQEVIADLSLSVYKGELCCLLGPSGCGKTTTLKMIAGLLEPDAGAVILDGKDITHMPPQRRNVGLVFQNYALFPHMNVYDNVAYGLRRRKVPRDEIKTRVARVLELVQLGEYGQRRIHELSGGQQQRIALARSLVIEPKLLLLDEPLSNLDARLRADMRREIRHIQRTLGITAIHVTHDQEEAMSISDRIVLMNQGLIEQIGTPRDIYENPATKFVADFIGQVNFLRGRVVDQKLLLLGEHFVLPEGRWTEGMDVICSIRPERVGVQEAGTSPLRATVRDVTYFGSMVRYHASAEAGKEKSVELAIELPSPLAVYQVGEQISLHLRVEDMQIFPFGSEAQVYS
jgi:spermidine/putrescine ABC transporter ATP-binding subunit